MSERNERLRLSENYKKYGAIFRDIIERIPVEYPRKRRILPRPSPFEIYEKNCVELYKKWGRAQRISNIIRGLKTEVNYPSDDYKSMSKLFAYLGLVESLGVTLVDMALILLIASGKHVHTRGPFTKHVTSLNELEKISLSEKLELLKDEGLDIFEFIDETRRNQIAHLKLTIQNDGEIKDEGNNTIHIDDDISKFWDGVDIIKLVLEDLRFLQSLETLSSIVGAERGNDYE